MVATNIDIRERLHSKPPADDLFELLIAEWDSTVELFNKDSQNQFCRRTLFRNAFSFVEGLLHHLKARTYRHYFRVIVPVVLLWKEHFDLDFPESGFLRLVDEDVLLSLLDKKVHIDEEGKWQLKDNWLSSVTNVRFTFRIIAHVYGIDTTRDPFREAGWIAFRRCVTVRNRVIHPKALDEFEVKDSEIEDLTEAIAWFKRTVVAFMNEVVKAIEWDPERVARFVPMVPENERGAFVARLMEIFDFRDDKLKSAGR